MTADGDGGWWLIETHKVRVRPCTDSHIRLHGGVNFEDRVDDYKLFHDSTDRYVLYLDSSSRSVNVYPRPATVMPSSLRVCQKWSLTDFAFEIFDVVKWILSRHTPHVFGINVTKGICVKLSITTGSVTMTKRCAQVPPGTWEQWVITLPDDDNQLWTLKDSGIADAVFSCGRDGKLTRLTGPEPAWCCPYFDGSVMVFYEHARNVVDIIRRPLGLREAWIKRVVLGKTV